MAYKAVDLSHEVDLVSVLTENSRIIFEDEWGNRYRIDASYKPAHDDGQLICYLQYHEDAPPWSTIKGAI